MFNCLVDNNKHSYRTLPDKKKIQKKSVSFLQAWCFVLVGERQFELLSAPRIGKFKCLPGNGNKGNEGNCLLCCLRAVLDLFLALNQTQPTKHTLFFSTSHRRFQCGFHCQDCIPTTQFQTLFRIIITIKYYHYYTYFLDNVHIWMAPTL